MDRPKASMLALPREIRDQIYELALISDLPIIVWSGGWQADAPKLPLHQKWAWDLGQRAGEPNCPFPCQRVANKTAVKHSLQFLAFNILLSHPMLSREAAGFFYQKNTFQFLGSHNWDPIAAWLNNIGRYNRSFLTVLDIEVPRLDRVWELKDGRRIPCLYTKEIVYPRNRWLKWTPAPSGVNSEGVVDNINPVVEDIFRSIGNRHGNSRITLNFKMESGFIPGVPGSFDFEDPSGGYTSMDLPNLVELFRRMYAGTSTTQNSVEVFWMGEMDLLGFNYNVSTKAFNSWITVDAALYRCMELSPNHPDKAPQSVECVRWKLRHRVPSLEWTVADPSEYMCAVTYADRCEDHFSSISYTPTVIPALPHASRPAPNEVLKGPEGPAEWMLWWTPNVCWCLEPVKKFDYQFIETQSCALEIGNNRNRDSEERC
ncbi:MAG: hypothetical protein M1821_006475 [Bathelium mastoideum]|nr:MAG: hypothetical protein M1821_006475 [Bathelium mastoideum]KAI9693751.1 MAG: hypothetical protein M1822_003022 [Bathelium mastoideum]